MKTGYIYIITNTENDKVYIGQTARDIESRFHEHKWEARNLRHNSHLHKAMAKYGIDKFSIKILEEPLIEQLDEREKYWIKEYNSVKNGYNMTIGGTNGIPKGIKFGVVEKDLVFESKAEAARLISKYTSWGEKFIAEKLADVVNTEKTFCDYHFIYLPEEVECSDDLTIEDWIITLNIRYQGQKIHCIQLNMDFSTVGEAAAYILENNLYIGNAQMPIPTLVTSIGKNIAGKIDCLTSTKGNLQFEKLPGTVKKEKTIIQKYRIYCPEINKEFESSVDAANYFINEKIWTGIKLKTAKLRISDVLNGIFPHYKGYTFKKV